MIHAIEARQPEQNPTSIFLLAILAYVGLLSLASVLNSGLLKGLSYAVAIAIFVMLTVVMLFLPKEGQRPAALFWSLTLYYAGFICSLLVHHKAPQYSDLIKMFMAPAFLLFGIAFEHNRKDFLWRHKPVRLGFWMLALVPLALGVLQVISGHVVGGGREVALLGAGKEFSIFPNRNNAALYAVTLLALYTVLSGRAVRNVLIILAIGACFGTLGVLAALVVGLGVTVVKLPTMKYAVVLVLVTIGVYWCFPELMIFKRITPVVDSFQLLNSGRIDLASVTYADLVRMLHTSDLSFLFRLKHWLNLANIFAMGSWYEWLFGYGVGASVLMSDLHLVPHNDYVRMLFECGVVTFVGFFSTVWLVIYYCGRRWETVPLIAVALYFFSENLINNYLGMAMFYFCAGVLVIRLRSEKCQK